MTPPCPVPYSAAQDDRDCTFLANAKGLVVPAD
jgi:hypothetical protein